MIYTVKLWSEESDVAEKVLAKETEYRRERLRTDAITLKDKLLKADKNLSYFAVLRGTWSMPVYKDYEGISVLSNN